MWVVAGMHRSGTSAAARLLHTLGVGMGRELIPADPFNPAGYFEDAEVVRFHQEVFATLLPAGAGAHADWGWTRTAAVSAPDLEPWRTTAARLVGDRVARGAPWGFKDPRATVVLDFWDRLLPDARYLVVYRRPDLVADSIQRLGADGFLRDPGASWRIWQHYNARLLDFVGRHRSRCVVVDAEVLRTDSDAVVDLLADRFGAPLGGPPPGPATEARAQIGPSHSAFDPDLARAVWPECFDLFDALGREADVAGPGRAAPDRRPSTAERADGRSMDDLSIVLCTRDDAPFLVEALSSVERCTDGRAEVLVCDAGTTDPEHLLVLDRLEAVGHHIVRQTGAGLPAARNRLIARARGAFVLPLDANDRLLPGFLEPALTAFAADPGLGVVSGDRRSIGGRTGDEAVPEFRRERVVPADEIDTCTMFRRDAWVEAGGYDETLDGGEHWELRLHLVALGWRSRHLPGPASERRVRPDSLLAAHNARERGRRSRRMQVERSPDLLVAALPGGLRWLALARPATPGRAVPRSTRWARWVARAYWRHQWRPRRLRLPARSARALPRGVRSHRSQGT